MLFLTPVSGILQGAPQSSTQQQQPQQQPPATPAQQPKPQQQPPAQQQQPPARNPFETVPQAQPEQQKPQLEQPKEAPKPPSSTPVQRQPGAPPENIIEDIEFRGTRRVPQDTLRAQISTRKGDPYNDDTLHQDFIRLWNTNRFDDIRLEREPGKTGWIIRFVLTERPVVRTIKYDGNKSVSVSEILDRFKERKVGLVVEQQYDQAKVQRARNVILEYLAERGRQYAKVEPEVHRVPPSSLEIVFKIDEGPKVKVGQINIVGNNAFSDKEVIRAMKNSHPIGIPHSILFENLFAKTYDSTKLEEDKSRVQDFYQQHGYFLARAVDSSVVIVDTGGHGFRIPLIKTNKPGKAANISVTMDEGKEYRLNNILFTGVKFFRTPEALMKPLFGMSQGDVFSTSKLRKGIENMRKLYGEFGFINFVGDPSFDPDPKNAKIDLTLSVDEGKQFFVRRIDFSGNATTRDKVIRRELLIDEGDMFNTRLWNLSILRLNQLGYFEPLKEEEAADIHQDPRTDTVDVTLKVKERGKNSIQLNGGVSGIAGSFLGFSYSTNNFLGLGETLSLNSQLGTRLRSVQFGFTEPYLLDKPIQTGFTLYTQRFNYDQAREASILSGQNLIPLYQQLGQQNLLNYVSNGYGGTVFMSYPLRRSFARLGLSYGYDISNITTLTTASNQYFNYLDFQGVGGPNSLNGIRTSKVIPSYTFNTVNHPITPTAGKSLFFSVAFAGSVLGGNVNTLEPTLDAKYFRGGFKKGHVIGMHLLGRFLTGYGGKVAPPFNRYYAGGENDIRGFDIWGISPIAFLPSTAQVNVLNPDGTIRQQRVVSNGVVSFVNVTQTIPVYQLEFPGGDTNIVTNFEYRIPIVGPVTLAAFVDAGVDKLSLASQLKLNPGRIDQLNAEFPQAGFTGKAYIAPGTQKMRMSTGLEIQVLMPVVNAPFRVYWAYNPSVVREYLQPPIAVDRSVFPNAATYNSAVAQFGQPLPFFEKRSMFRFTIGRTF
ncbi:MAG TPA: outer membrane protein assembly factor BamA [Bryobacteraceae bacterium]|nr:outer membrane protein assembly factor BamA [Bryobacteraceae bacterium]